MTATTAADWIAVDWGTTNLRAYAMQGAEAIDRAASDDGMGRLAPQEFEPALRRLTDPWGLQNAVVIACGMVGSRQGWIEAPYREVPCRPMADSMARAPAKGGLTVHVVPGLSQNAPADVMRGEETQIAGFLSLHPGWDGIICLPGTHTKWVHVSAGEVVSFQTFMTGELFSLLGNASVLRHSMCSDRWDDGAFGHAVTDAMARPEALASRLFGLRASSLLHGTEAASIRSTVSGLLIGAELAAARAYWLGQKIAIVGAGAQSEAYRTALASQGVPSQLVDAESATLAGLTAAYLSLKEKA